jgi:flagellar assembly protein FliH
MSSSPRRAPDPASAGTPAPAPKEQPEALSFPYCEVTLPAGRQEFPRPGRGESESDAALVTAQARELGRRQGELEGRTKFEEQLAHERSAVAKALADFARDRAGYYQKIEAETVQLALGIARKILHREAQVDPLLLMGIVRVALERIEGATGVVLAVHPQQAADWQRYLASRMDPGDMPEIAEDPAMGPERCELRTSMGTAELGLEVQLKEIEQGLMDLLAARPREKEKP